MTTQWCIKVTTGQALRLYMARSRQLRKRASSRGPLPPLHMVRAFEAVARTGTMRRAADDLGISHAVISRHIRHLEAWLKARLTASGPRGTRLTRLEAAGAGITRPLKGPRLSDASLGLDAALAGAGVSLATRLTTGEEIAAGRLIELFTTRIQLGSYFLLAAPQLRKDPLIQGLYRWLLSQLRGDGAVICRHQNGLTFNIDLPFR